MNSTKIEPLMNKPIILQVGCHIMEGKYLGKGRVETCWSKISDLWSRLDDYDSWEYIN